VSEAKVDPADKSVLQSATGAGVDCEISLTFINFQKPI
jgi:hypothetical protein